MKSCYRRGRNNRDEESWTVTKNVYYVVENGVVASVAFTRVGSE